MNDEKRDRLANFIAKNKKLPPKALSQNEENTWLMIQMTKSKARPWRTALVGVIVAGFVVVVINLNQNLKSDSSLANIQAVEESLEMDFLDSSDFPLVTDIAVFVD
jgi:hypothetical protein